MLLNCGVGEDSWESLGQQGAQTSQSWRKSTLNIHWKNWCWSWSSTTLATCCKVLSLLLNTLSRLVIAFLPRNKCLWFSWLQALSAVILEPKKIKSVTASTYSPSICHEVMRLDAKILVFWMLSFKPAFSLSSFTLIKRLFSLQDSQTAFEQHRSSKASILWHSALFLVQLSHLYVTTGQR